MGLFGPPSLPGSQKSRCHWTRHVRNSGYRRLFHQNRSRQSRDMLICDSVKISSFSYPNRLYRLAVVMSCSYIFLNCYISLLLSDSVPDKGAKEYAVYKPYLNYFYFLDAIVTVMFRVSILILLSRHLLMALQSTQMSTWQACMTYTLSKFWFIFFGWMFIDANQFRCLLVPVAISLFYRKWLLTRVARGQWRLQNTYAIMIRSSSNMLRGFCPHLKRSCHRASHLRNTVMLLVCILNKGNIPSDLLFPGFQYFQHGYLSGEYFTTSSSSTVIPCNI